MWYLIFIPILNASYAAELIFSSSYASWQRSFPFYLNTSTWGISYSGSRRCKVGRENYINLYHTTQDGSTPLFLASNNGKTDVVDLLVNTGANIHLANKVNYLNIDKQMQIANFSHLGTYIYYKVRRCSSGDCSTDGTCPNSREAIAGKS